VRSYKNLSDHDFELLTAQLFSKSEGRAYEAFARGADGGIDLRYLSPDRSLAVIQCKHMEYSTFAQVRSAAKKEADKLRALSPSPSQYRFVTSKSLTAANKAEIRRILSPWMTSDNEVIGADDLELLLNEHPSVERNNIKLWLSNYAQLGRVLHAATWSRSKQLLDEITEALPRFVDTGTFGLASQQLHAEHVLVLSGPPGIGKTSIARMLVADAVSEGYEPIEVSTDIEEANATFDESTPQIFIYDDFLGATFLHDRLSKNEDKRLASFMRRCRRSKNSLFVLTTREHILQQAASWYDELERLDLPLRRLLIELKSYTRRERALILYNHLHHNQDLTESEKMSFAKDDGYLAIVDHPNYNPRIIEFATTEYEQASAGISPHGFALENLDNPERIWEQAFARQLDDDCRDIVLILSTLSSTISVSHLNLAFEALASESGKTRSHGALRQALRVLDDSFTRTVHSNSSEPEIAIANPSVADFAAAWLRANPRDAEKVVRGATLFEQLEWLQVQVVSHTSAPASLRVPFLAAMIRTFDAPPGDWWYGSFSKITPRSGLWEKRLLAVARMRGELSGGSTGAFEAWWRENLDQAIQVWEVGVTRDLRSAIALACLLQDTGNLTHRERSAITNVAEAASDASEWDAVVDAVLDSPSVFDEEGRNFAPVYENWVEGHLEDSIEDVADLDELRQLERLAEQLGVSTHQHFWADAFDAIDNRPESEWAQPEGRKLEQQFAPDASNEELRTLFTHLRN
jgi:hypothetical protein